MPRFTQQLADLICAKLNQQTDYHLLEIIGECEFRTTTNCGWIAYGLKDIVSAVAQNMLRLREEKLSNAQKTPV